MLSELKFVQGAVAKKEFIPALTHFAIEGGTVRGYNGSLALCSPIPFDIECKPKAEPLVRAIANCSDTVSLSLTPSGRLAIKSGKFKAFVDCVDGVTPHVLPDGDAVDIDGAVLLEAMKRIAPFIGDDASRPWSNGILLLGDSAFATNNIVLVEYWTGLKLPKPLNVPRAAVREVLRIGEPPIGALVSDSALTLHFAGGRWLRTQLYDTQWPDLRKVLDKPSNPSPINPEIFEALATIKPFVDKIGRVYFRQGLATHLEDNEGAAHEIEGFDHTGIYQNEMLALLEGTAQSIDWSLYPAPCMFFGERLRGAIVGMRQ